MYKRSLTPVRYRGQYIPDYFVDCEGNVWSFKRSKTIILSWSLNKRNQYPRVTIRYNGEVIKALVHRIVCETFHEKPLPEGVTEEEWKRTPKSVKAHFEHYWEVNHIDHVRTNFHPSNLEWVSCKQNVERYVEYRQKNKS